jgi:hypothetical protein
MKFLSLSVMCGVVATPAVACDLCSVYSAAQARGEIGKGWFAGVAEQFTHFETMQLEGHEVANPTGQYLNSSLSQLFAGYNFSDRFGLQFNLPVIYRSFKRPEGFAIDRGTESGIGDVSLIGSFRALQIEEKESTFLWTILGGIKFPTGDTRRIGEELTEVVIPGAPESGIHGHDLTLGSGSVDGIVGTGVFARYKKWFFNASVQYAIRTRGDFDYQFANDLTWMGGPGYFIALDNDYSVSVRLNISGETKGLDRFQGTAADDTGVTAVYIGPQVTFSWTDKLSVELGADFPVRMANSALQCVPDYRIRGGLSWHF